jgi:hypothetical protein
MSEATPARLRGAPLLAARAAALIVSVGVVVLLMVRAGGGRRPEEPVVEAEARSAAPPRAALAVSSSAAARVFFPDSKADPHVVRPERAAASGAPFLPPLTLNPAASATAPGAPKPRYFPSTKDLGGPIVDPQPAGGDER